MSGIRGIDSGRTDPYEGTKNINSQVGGVEDAQSVASGQPVSPTAEQPEKITEKEKKALQELATERVAEEQIKAQIKQTQLATDLDAANEAKGIEDKKQAENKDRYHFDYDDGQNQAVPFRNQNGELQRWDVTEKKWS